MEEAGKGELSITLPFALTATLKYSRPGDKERGLADTFPYCLHHEPSSEKKDFAGGNIICGIITMCFQLSEV